jgi:hypothetical protein
MKLYFDKSGEVAHSIEYWESYMKKHLIEELELFEAKRVTGSDYFWCKAVEEVGEKGECGKQCKDYKPYNGVSGMCRHNGYLYESTGKSFVHRVKLEYSDFTRSERSNISEFFSNLVKFLKK